MHKRKQILGINIDFGLSYADVVSQIDFLIQKKEPGKYICTTNPEFVVDAQHDPLFKEIINNASLSVPDGSGLLYANEYLEEVRNYRPDNKFLFVVRNLVAGFKVGLSLNKNSTALHDTITGVTLTDKLSELAAKKGYTVYLLGGKYGADLSDRDMATDAAAALKKKYPNLNIVGSTSGFSRYPVDDEKTVEHIKQDMLQNGVSRVDILLVAYNHGYQDKWIVRNAHKIPATVSMGVGRTFAVLANYWPKDPYIIEKYNLGWLYRLITQPRRINRIYKAFPLFPFLVFMGNINNPVRYIDD